MVDQGSEYFDVLRVTDEESAYAALESALAKAFEGQAIKLDFDSWPILRLKYKGDKFKGTITPDIAQAILDLQDVLSRSYLHAVKNTTNLRGLTEEDRRAIQVIASVEEGSSLIEVNLGPWAEKLAFDLVGKMTGTEIIVVVVGTAAVLTGAFLMRQHLNNRSAEKKLSLENQGRFDLSQEESRRLKIVTDAMAANSVTREAGANAEAVRDSFLKSAFDAESMTVQDDVVVTANDAKLTYRAKRREPIPVQMNGNYLVKSFTWSSDNQSARVRVQREEDQNEFTADISVSALTVDQKTRFKNATFDQLRVYLQINATLLNDQVTTATIVSVDEQPPKAAERG